MVAAKLRSSLLRRPRALKLMWHSAKKNSPNSILPHIIRSAPAERPKQTPLPSAPLPGGVPVMVSWSGPVSLRKFLAGGLDGIAPTVVILFPIRLTGAVGNTLLVIELRLTVVFMTTVSVFGRTLKILGVLVLLQ